MESFFLQNGKQVEGTGVPDVDLVLRETDSPLTVRRASPSSVVSPRGICTSTPKGNTDGSNTSSHYAFNTPKFTSPECPGHERYSRGKHQALDTDDRSVRGNFVGEKKYSVQKLSLGDFIQSDSRKGNKKKSPLPRESTNARANCNNSMIRHLPKALDITDETAFPMVGSMPPQDKQPKRRINPTRIVPASGPRSNKSNPFNSNSKNLFGFPQGSSPSSSFNALSEEGGKTLEEEREMLRQERLRLQEVALKEPVSKCGAGRESPPIQNLQKSAGKLNEYKEASLDQVTQKPLLDAIAQLYAELTLCNMVPSVMVELHYVIQLLTVRVLNTEELEGVENESEVYLDNLNNCVYFATKVLSTMLELVKLLDRTTITLLSENSRIHIFSVELQRQLVNFLDNPPSVPPLSQHPKSPIGGVSFQSETDNRHNFSCDQAFHTFRKQRDTFYEVGIFIS